MNRQLYEETVARLNEVNKVVADLDPAIRADALALLRPYVIGNVEASAVDEIDGGATPRIAATSSADYERLIEEHESDKDSLNALLVLAIYYDRHGRGPLQMPELKAVAAEYNVAVPERIDMFFKAHKRDGKEVLRKHADGWKITPAGENWLKATYNVTRGKQPLGGGSDES